MSAPDLTGRTALVTGASAGIGQGIARALAAAGAEVHGLARGRGEDRSARGTPEDCSARGMVEECSARGTGETRVRWHCVDLADPRAIAGFLAGFAPPRLDILVHAAGLLLPDGFGTEEGGLEALDRQMAVNLRAPWQLTHALLPRLVAAKGWVVMLNSSIWLNARAGLAGYAASKYAAKAMTDALRAEVNGQGVRVLSLYPGRTASRMQAEASAAAGAPYAPERLLQPESIAASLLAALALPETAEVTDLHIRPALKG